MASANLKTDFVDGNILPASDLNNNFSAIKAALDANGIQLEAIIQEAEKRLLRELQVITAERGWDWDGTEPGERVTFFKGNKSQVDAQPITDGRLLYDKETGQVYLDDNGSRLLMYAAIESGSDSYGNWIKYADGTMIQYGKKTSKGFSYGDLCSMSKAFINTNYTVTLSRVLQNRDDGTYDQTLRQINYLWYPSLSQTFAIFAAYEDGTSPEINTVVSWLAIGKWK